MSFVLLFLGGVDKGRIKSNNFGDLPPQARAIFERLGIDPQQLHPDLQKRVTQLTDTNKSKPTRKLEASPQTQPQLEPREPIPPHPPGHQLQLGNLRAPTPPPPFVPPSPTPTLVSRPHSPSTSVPGKFHNIKNIRGKRLFFGFQRGHFC